MAHITFVISKGELYSVDDNEVPTLLGPAYAGRGSCINDPTKIWVPKTGPLPIGWYLIGKPEDLPASVGIFALPLEPYPENDMHDRGGFFCHGESESDAKTGERTSSRRLHRLF